MTAHHLAFDLDHAHIGASSREEAMQRRENIISSAAIRAMLYAARGLPPATGCALASTHRPAASCDQAAATVCAQADSVRCRTQCEHCAEPIKPCVCTEVGACVSGGCCGACRSRLEVLRLPSEDTEGGAL